MLLLQKFIDEPVVFLSNLYHLNLSSDGKRFVCKSEYCPFKINATNPLRDESLPMCHPLNSWKFEKCSKGELKILEEMTADFNPVCQVPPQPTFGGSGLSNAFFGKNPFPNFPGI